MKIDKIFEPKIKGNFFFGYYDKPQISPCNEYFLSHKINFLDRYPNYDDEIDVGYFDINNGKFLKIESTSACNFQQGSMLNWFFKSDEIIFNKLVNGNYRSLIKNIKNNNSNLIDCPLYALSNNKDFFLTINFLNLSIHKRGYGYDYKFKSNFKNYFHDPKEIGIWIYVFSKNKIFKLIDIKEIHNDNNCWIEHISISPDNYHFIFMLRYKLNDGGIRDKLYLSNIDKNTLVEIKTFARGSHYNWIDNNSFIIYGGVNTSFNKIRHQKTLQNLTYAKKLIKIYHKLIKHNTDLSKFITGDSYYIYNIETKIKKKIQAKFNKEDGHPSVSNNYKNLMITDQYSDIINNKYPKLFLYDLKESKLIEELKFDSISTLDNSGFRCDLHPRFSTDGKFFSIDLFLDQQRSFQIYKITE